MRIVPTLLCLTFCAVAVALPPVHAATLQEEYRALENRREKLEKQRRDYEERLKLLTEHLDDVAENLNDCVYKTRLETLKLKEQRIYQNWRLIWESRLKEAEVARKTTEEERRKLIQLWRELGEVRRKFEQRRMEIERTHTHKGPGSAYEQEFRQYMENMRTAYLDRIKNQLFQGYEDYLNGAEGYLMFLKGSLELCLSNKMGTPEETPPKSGS